jgi:hypothetical protein
MRTFAYLVLMSIACVAGFLALVDLSHNLVGPAILGLVGAWCLGYLALEIYNGGERKSGA